MGSRKNQKRQIGPVDHIGFTVQDIKPIVKRLRQAGIHLHTEQPRKGIEKGELFIFLDGPDGERLELWQAGQKI